jgi:hypothetical protein
MVANSHPKNSPRERCPMVITRVASRVEGHGDVDQTDCPGRCFSMSDLNRRPPARGEKDLPRHARKLSSPVSPLKREAARKHFGKSWVPHCRFGGRCAYSIPKTGSRRERFEEQLLLATIWLSVLSRMTVSTVRDAMAPAGKSGGGCAPSHSPIDVRVPIIVAIVARQPEAAWPRATISAVMWRMPQTIEV